jgi:hypothetical protein
MSDNEQIVQLLERLYEIVDGRLDEVASYSASIANALQTTNDLLQQLVDAQR